MFGLGNFKTGEHPGWGIVITHCFVQGYRGQLKSRKIQKMKFDEGKSSGKSRVVAKMLVAKEKLSVYTAEGESSPLEGKTSS